MLLSGSTECWEWQISQVWLQEDVTVAGDGTCPLRSPGCWGWGWGWGGGLAPIDFQIPSQQKVCPWGFPWLVDVGPDFHGNLWLLAARKSPEHQV